MSNMYTGTNQVAITSQEMIAAACCDMMQRQPLERISVSALCKEAKVSRQTFYSLFSTKENVVIYLLTHRCAASITDYLQGKDSLTLEDICHCYALYMEENLSLIRLVLKNGLASLLVRAFYESILRSPRLIFSHTGTHFDDYVAYFIAGGLVTIAKRYLDQEASFRREEFEQLSLRLFQGDFFEK